MSITTAQAASAAATALHAFAHDQDAKAARAGLSTGGQWTLTALSTAVHHAYPDAAYGPRLAPASLRAAADVLSALHAFLCDDWKRATAEHDPALPLIDTAGDIAFAACQVLDGDRSRVRRDA